MAGISGFDFKDDARAAASVDQDRDGRLDVWVKNRTGPQLRFLHNDTGSSHHYVSLKLRGVRSNRDAVGAVVELTAGGRRRVRQVAAGDGYLAQSSSTIHFGLGDAGSIERLVVRWPGGEAETFEPVPVDGRYLVVEGSGRAQPLEVEHARLPAASRPAAGAAQPARLLLKTPLPLPPVLLERLGVTQGETTLINLWAHWCGPCAEEVESWIAHGDPSIRWLPWSLDKVEDREAAAAWLRDRHEAVGSESVAAPAFVDPETLDILSAVLEHVTGRDSELPIPANLLIDGNGRLQLLYFGSVPPERLRSEARAALDPALLPARRSLWPGRWYYRSHRNYGALADRLDACGRIDAAEFYRALVPRGRFE